MAYSDAWYTPSNLLSKTVPEKEIRAEYTRLRDIAQKRVKRLAESEWSVSRAFQQYKSGFKKLADIKDATDLAYSMSELYKFVSSGYTVRNLRKQKKEALKTLHKHKYGFVTYKNYEKFAEFMEDYRDSSMDKKNQGSPDAADLYYQVERLGMDKDKVAKDFKFWLENIDILADLTPSKGKSAGNVAAIKQRVKRQIKRNSKRSSKRI